MKLLLENGEITLPSNFCFEIEHHHPFFSDKGTTSIPVDIPATPENLAILGYPSRLGHSISSPKTLPACLSSGMYQEMGTLVIGDITKNWISCSFAINESILYINLQGRKLKDIFSSKEDLVFGTKASGGYVQDVLFRMHKVPNIDEFYPQYEGLRIFPAAVTEDDYGFHMLNEVNLSGEDFIYEERSLTKDGKTMTYPKLYGLTPFLSLWKVLELTFELCGYTVDTNVFKSHYSLNKLVVLNNCADTCVRGYISWKDLVPDMTVGELIRWLKDKFAAFICCKGRKVNILCMEYLLDIESYNEKPDFDLSSVLDSSDMNIIYPAPRRVVIDCDKSLKYAAPPQDISVLDYIAQQGEILCDIQLPSVRDDNPELWSTLSSLSIQRVISEIDGTIYQIPKNVDSSPMIDARKRLGSLAFKYERDGNGEIDERITIDRFVPTMYDLAGLPYPFIGNLIHFHTNVTGMEESPFDQPMQICYAYFGTSWYGSTQHIGTDGEECFSGSVPLTPDGIYCRFWRMYNQMLSKQYPELHFSSAINCTESDFSFAATKVYKNQLVIVKSYKTIISSEGVQYSDIVLQLCPLHQFTTEDKPFYINRVIQWKLVNTLKDIPESNTIIPSDGYADYSIADAPTYPPTLGAVALLRGRYGMSDYSHVYTWWEYFIGVIS